MKVLQIFFKSVFVYFDRQISNPMSIFVGHNRKPLIIQTNKEFSWLLRVSKRDVATVTSRLCPVRVDSTAGQRFF